VWTDVETKVTITCKCYRQAMQVTCPNAELWLAGPMSARSSGATNVVITVMSWKREHKKEVESFLKAQKRSNEDWLKLHAGICTPMWCSLIPEDISRLMDTGEARGYSGNGYRSSGKGNRRCREKGQEDRAVQSVEGDYLASLAKRRDMKE
jgi:hypothetical protein